MAGSLTGVIAGLDQPIYLGVPGVPGTGNNASSVGGFSLLDNAQNQLNSIGQSLADSTGVPILGQLGNLSAAGSTVADAAQALPGSGLAAAIGTATATTNWTALFLRGVIIILGFIFVAVGLSMFKNVGDTIVNISGLNDAGKGIKRIAKGKK